MKVKSVAVLSAVGMLLTSVSVWSLTNPRSKPVAPTGELGSSPLLVDDPPASALTQFEQDGTLDLEGRVGHAKLLADSPGETFVLANVRASDVAASTPAPLNLAIVLDRSGSMKGRRLENALSAARGMIHRLRDGDVVSVITYNTQTETVLPPTTIDSLSRSRADGALSGVTAQGDTCISCGIDAGMAALRQRSGMVDRILLLSDGEATAGIRDLGGFRRLADQARGMNCAISSIGVDVDYNEQVLSALALESNGKHHFAENASDVARAFDEELASLKSTVAKDVEVELTLAPGVEAVQVIDRASRRVGDRVIVPLGSLAKDEEKTVLVRVKLPRGATGERPLAELSLNWSTADGRQEHARGDLGLTLVKDAAEVSRLDPLVATRLGNTDTANTLTQVNQLIKDGDLDRASRRLQSKLDQIEKSKGELAAAAPADERAKVNTTVDKQAEVLRKAQTRLKSAPKPSAPGGKRAGAVEVRNNQAAADPFRL